MDRRQFLSWSAGGGLALALAPHGASAKPLSPWITLRPDGRVVLTTTALEMGQGSRTGQAQILADELCVPWESVEVVQAPEAEPYLMEGALFSGGSETVRTRWDLLRKAGASVRWQLRAAAAQRWGVEPSACRAAVGRVSHEPSGRSLAYGELAEAAAAIAPPADPPLKGPAERRYIGKPVATLAQADKLTGAARYGIDFRLPGMLHATVRASPQFGGELVSVDEAPALAVPGVRKVVRLNDAVAVVADSTWSAFKGARALDPQWRVATPAADSAEISRRLAAALDAPDAIVSPRQGGAEARTRLRAALASAPRKHEATYEIAYLAHAPLEPMNATARRTEGGGVEIWAPCQSPTWARDDVVAMTGLPKEKIVIHPLLMGGGFGRRLKGDYAARAAQVAMALDAPVQVLWTREEDFGHDHYRPAMHMVIRAPVPADGLLTGYEVLTATADDRTGGHMPAPYVMKDYAATLATVKAGVPIGAWRSVDPGMSLFAKESFIDECAHLAGADPLAYRDRLLGDNARARRALMAAADAIGWKTPREPGVGRGLALLHEWDTVVAHAVEVRALGRRLKVEKIVAAVDIGTAVNPQQVRAQFEGGGLMGLSAALGEAVTIQDGRAVEANFDAYPVLRMRQAPQVEVILLDSPDAKLGGAGEPPVPGIAPALANAVFQATGERVRRLPFTSAGFEV